jgi:lipid-A-disaccharide synthase
MQKIKKIVISACELSADNYAANIALELKKIDPKIQIIGIGSDASKNAGIDVRFDMSKISTIGIFEPIRFLPQLILFYFKLKKLLKEENPDLFIPIDNQGFHLMCCRLAKKLNINVQYFIAPQEWHWGTLKGGRKVASVVDKVLAIFPQEERFYKKCNLDTVYVGHPVTDRVRDFRSTATKENIITIFPGSRVQEIERMLPVFIEAVEKFIRKSNLKPVISVASIQYEGLIKEILEKNNCNFELYIGNSIELMSKTNVSLVTSGTISLEHCLMNVPHVVAYKFNPLTFFIANTFFKKTLARIKFMSMANTLLDEEVFPELLQSAVTPESLCKKLYAVESNNNHIIQKCNKLWAQLDKGNVSRAIAGQLLKS